LQVSHAEVIDQIIQRIPGSPDEAFALLADPDRSVRTMALSYAYSGAKDDPRLIPALIADLHSEPNEYGRSQSAIRLGLMAQRSDIRATAALHRSIAEDEELMVRLSARYALALMTERPGESRSK
jgi:hypothetical protein